MSNLNGYRGRHRPREEGNHAAADIYTGVAYQNLAVPQIADEVINKLLLPVGGADGVIVLDGLDNIALTFNTTGMYRGSRVSGKAAEVAMFIEG